MIYEICLQKHGEVLWQTMRAIMMGQCNTFKAQQQVRTARLRFLVVYMVSETRTEKFHRLSFFCSYLHCIGFQECQTSPRSDNAVITSLFCVESNEQWGQRDSIQYFCG